jgi:hypothetical protein
MAQEASLETYFNAEELDGARKLVEIFQGKLLVSGELSRGDAVLLGTYMISNAEKTSEVSKEETAKFTIRLGVPPTEFSKGLSDLKSSKLISEADGRIGLTFAGLKKVRQMLAPTRQQTGVQKPSESGEIPSIGAPSTAKEAITSLLSSEWGKKPRTLREITDALEVSALYYPVATLAGVLNYMTKSGDVRRMKSNGTFAYVLKNK